jgi:aldehyde dehydrogenase (NAD+)/betaine-aldehyde dehydrogenase
LSSLLSELSAGPTVYSDGSWTQGAGAGFSSVNPATEEPLAELRSADAQQVDDAVGAAHAAARSWARTEPAYRARLLRRLADLIEAQAGPLADLVTAEVGSPITLARGLQVGQPIKNFRWAADAALRGPRGGYREQLPMSYGSVRAESVLLRQPIGVVAAIVPYNYPLNMISWKVAPALAAGCPVVLLPSPRGALCALAFLRLAEQVGFPPGVLNLLIGGAEVGERLVADDRVDLVSFTGSNAVGARVMAVAAEHNAKVVLELGGKSPNLVLPGVDIESVIAPSILRFVRNAGQGCGATTRILVSDRDYDEFVDRAQAFIAKVLVVGDPTSESTEVGPLISAEHRARVEGYLERAVAAGAEILAGGDRPADQPRGFYLNPTLVGRLGSDSELCQDELFAPVAAVLAYSTVDEAIAIANDSRYGLNAVVWGEQAAALEVADQLDSGTVAINGGGDMRSDVPWGGVKQSGVGAEMGEDGFGEFFRVKHLTWRSA